MIQLEKHPDGWYFGLRIFKRGFDLLYARKQYLFAQISNSPILWVSVGQHLRVTKSSGWTTKFTSKFIALGTTIRPIKMGRSVNENRRRKVHREENGTTRLARIIGPVNDGNL